VKKEAARVQQAKRDAPSLKHCERRIAETITNHGATDFDAEAVGGFNDVSLLLLWH